MKHTIVIAMWIIAILHAYMIFDSAGTEQLPMQFDMNGRPTWYASAWEFFSWQVTFLTFMNGVLLGVSMWLPKSSFRLINVPWKDYWTSSQELKTECIRITQTLLTIAAVWVNAILMLSQEMIAYRALEKSFLFPFQVTLTVFLLVTFGGTALFLLSVFCLYKPKPH